MKNVDSYKTLSDILIVDDLEANLMYLKSILVLAGYKVRTANSGKLALQMVDEKKPSLILLDVVMPGLSGYDVCETLKSGPATENIPVIFVSSMSDNEAKLKGFQYGAVDYVNKPFNNEEIIARVNAHLSLYFMQLELEQKNIKLDEENKLRRYTEQLLLTSKERYQSLFTTMTEGYVLFDLVDNSADGSFGLTISEVNPSFEALSNLSEKKLIGMDINELLPGYNWDIIGQLADVARKGKNLSTEQYVKSLDKYLKINAYKFQEGRIAILLSDITEQKRNEKMRIATEVAESAYRAKSEFLANMSHEIRTPLNAIVGFTELLLNSPLNEKQLAQIKSVDNSAKHLMLLLNDLLDLSMIEAGKLKIDNCQSNFAELIMHVRNVFYPKFEEKGIEFKIEFLSQLPLFIKLDMNRLRQVLFNMLSNALKFTEKGHVLLCMEKIPKAGATEKIDLHLSVEDTGIGILPEYQETIFEAFNPRIVNSPKKYGGTGLGLTISKKLVEMMGGEITLTSQYGKGSKFDIWLYDIEFVSPEVIPDNINDTESASIVAGADTVGNFELNNVLTNKTKLSGQQKELLPRVLEILENELLPESIMVAELQKMDKIKKFASNLIQLGKDYNFSEINLYGMMIYKFADSFEIEQLTDCLTKFPDFIKKYKSF